MANSHFPSGGGSGTVTTTSPITGDGSSGTPIGLSTPLSAANGGTGISSLGTGVATWLGTPSSANLAAALTDETGTGANVFATSPTLTNSITLNQPFNQAGLIVNANSSGSADTSPIGITIQTDGSDNGASSVVFAIKSGANPVGSTLTSTKNGLLKSVGGIYVGSGAISGTPSALFTGTLVVGSDKAIGFSSNTNAGVGLETAFWRHAANSVALRNGTSAQQLRVDNTFASSTSWETFAVDWQTTANVCLIGAQKGSGGGTARVMSIVYGGTSTPAISVPITSGDITFGGTLAPTGYKSSDGSAGVTAGPFTAITAITVKNGLVTAITGT